MKRIVLALFVSAAFLATVESAEAGCRNCRRVFRWRQHWGQSYHGGSHCNGGNCYVR